MNRMTEEEKVLMWEEPLENYFSKEEYPFQKETYELIGICMEVHRVLGRGFAEVVYKDAIEFELQQRKINYEREKNLSIHYKEIILQRSFNADFLVYEKIILEAKAKSGVVEDDIGQIVNYLSATKLKIGLLVNFGEDSLKFKRIIR